MNVHPFSVSTPAKPSEKARVPKQGLDDDFSPSVDVTSLLVDPDGRQPFRKSPQELYVGSMTACP
jgi:hypothetical protein